MSRVHKGDTDTNADTGTVHYREGCSKTKGIALVMFLSRCITWSGQDATSDKGRSRDKVWNNWPAIFKGGHEGQEKSEKMFQTKEEQRGMKPNAINDPGLGTLSGMFSWQLSNLNGVCELDWSVIVNDLVLIGYYIDVWECCLQEIHFLSSGMTGHVDGILKNLRAKLFCTRSQFFITMKLFHHKNKDGKNLIFTTNLVEEKRNLK